MGKTFGFDDAGNWVAKQPAVIDLLDDGTSAFAPGFELPGGDYRAGDDVPDSTISKRDYQLFIHYCWTARSMGLKAEKPPRLPKKIRWTPAAEERATKAWKNKQS